MSHYSLIPRLGAVRMLTKLAVLFFATLLGLSWLATPAGATIRTWNGASNGYWSEPSNWSPVGAPQNGDDLVFNNAPGSNMTNDISGLSARTLQFNHSGAVWGPGSLTVTVGISEFSPDGGPTALNVPFLDLGGNVSIQSNDSSGWGYVLNCTTRLNGHTLSVYAQNSGTVHFQSPIVGSGQIKFASGTNYLDFQSGTAGSASVDVLAGDLVLATVSGLSISGPLHIHSGATVELHAHNTIDAASPVVIEAGAKLLLDNHYCYFGNLEMRGGLLDSGPAGQTVFQDGPFNFNTTNETAVLAGNVFGLTISNSKPALSVNGPFSLSLVVQSNLVGEFIKTGIGFTRLLAPNSFTLLVLQQGVVEADHNFSLGTNGVVELTGGALSLRSVNITNVALTVHAAQSLQLDGRYGCLLTCLNTCSWTGPVTLTTNLFVFVAGDLTISGQITGAGGLSFWSGVAHITGSVGNLFSGTLISQCQLLELGKPSGVKAYSGSLVAGGGSGGPYEVRWLHPYQNVGATLTLYSNAVVNLNNNNEDFGSVTFNGGEVETGTGQFAIYAPLTVNASPSSAVINGFLGLPAGDSRFFVVNDGAADCDLIVNAVIFGTPTYFVKQGAGTMCLTAANSYDAVTLLEAGILDVNNASALGTAAGTVIFDGATLRLNGTGTMAENFEVVGAGVGGTHGAVEAPTSSSFTLTGDMLLDGATTFNVAASAGLGLNGLVHGTGPLTKIGLGNLVFGGSLNDTYSNATFVNAGTLLLAKSANKISVPGDLVVGPAAAGQPAVARLLQAGGMGGTVVTVNGNSLFDLNGFNQTLTSLSLNDGGDAQTGAGLLGLADSAVVSVGSLSLSGSHVSSSITGNIGLTPNAPASFSVSPYSPAFPFDSNAELDVRAVISVDPENPSLIPAGISKSGAGRMRLAGNNSYVGQTIINDGTLQVDGAQPSSPVVVNAGARLQGVGTAGHINLKAASAVLAPGDSPGILTCSNFDSGSGSGIFQVELNGTTAGSGYDQLNVRGTVNLNKVTLSASLGFASSVGDQFTIISNDGIDAVNGTFNGLPQSAKLYIGGQLFQISYTGGGRGNGVVLTRLVTPPPPVLTIQRAGTNLVRLLWPTNNPPFRLTSETNLTTDNWSSVLPSPVVIGTNDVLTNTASDPSRFYRRVNP